jgi:DNA-binding NarL/FixJ family response regulator
MGNASQIRLLVTDDSKPIRDSIRRLFSESPDIVISGEATNGLEALEMARTSPYDLVLLDITMPGKHGLEILSELKLEHPKLPVLILSVYPPDQFKARAMALGAAGYVTKDRAPDELANEVRRAVRNMDQARQ